MCNREVVLMFLLGPIRAFMLFFRLIFGSISGKYCFIIDDVEANKDLIIDDDTTDIENIDGGHNTLLLSAEKSTEAIDHNDMSAFFSSEKVSHLDLIRLVHSHERPKICVPLVRGHHHYLIIMLSFGNGRGFGSDELPYVNWLVVNITKRNPNGQTVFSYVQPVHTDTPVRRYWIVFCKQKGDQAITLETLGEQYKNRSKFDFAEFEKQHNGAKSIQLFTKAT
ncbi:hypothetical protein ACOME3_002264 [Neoechinorhynchus agilis]